MATVQCGPEGSAWNCADEEFGGLDRRFQALADEKRLRILSILCSGERCVCELADGLDVGQSLLSFHLKTLREAGMVRDRREGRWIFYAVEPASLRTLARELEELADAAGAPRNV